MGSQLLGPLKGLFVLPGLDEFWIAAKQYVRHFPSVEFRGAGVDGRGEEVILEWIAEGGGLVRQGAGDQADYGVRNHGGRDFPSAQDIVTYWNLARDKVLADAVVYSLVMAAKDYYVFLEWETYWL